MSDLSRYRKFVVALAAALGVLGSALSDGAVTMEESVAVVLAFLGAVGVYQLPNEDAA